jgi:hypothetical protein
MRAEQASRVQIGADYDIVHIPYTDRLFGSTSEAAADAFEQLAAAVQAAGSLLSVTLHDVPSGMTPLQVRRRTAYRRVVDGAVGIVVSSEYELASAQDITDRARSASVIPLPVADACPMRPRPSGCDVAVLGFVYPDRGYEQVLEELPAGCRLLAIGRAADGHAVLPRELSAHARRLQRSWHLTGFLPEDELADRLLTAAVPVAPNRRVGASASIATWLAHGRRPLVPAGRYASELNARWPQTLQIYDPDRPGALKAAIRAALADPSSTVLTAGVAPGASTTEVAGAYRAHFQACRPALVPS